MVADARRERATALRRHVIDSELPDAAGRSDARPAFFTFGASKLDAILRSMSDGILTADPTGEVIDINDAALHLHGYRDPREMRKHLSEFPATFELSTLDGAVLPLEAWPLSRARRGERFHDLEIELLRKDTGVRRTLSYSGGPVADAGGEVALLLLVIRDISDQKRTERALREARDALEQRVAELARATAELESANRRLEHAALHDPLTGLPNRSLFADRLEHAQARHLRHPSEGFAVLFLDCDRFKVVNDTFGHAVGDALLEAIARRLRACVRPSDTVARLGGDEFTVLLEAPLAESEAQRIAERLQRELRLPYELGGATVRTSASIGIVFCDETRPPPPDLLRAADSAMYRAKMLGKARNALFTPTVAERATRQAQLERDLPEAVARDQLRVHYQPIVEPGGDAVGFEAFVRWLHPEHGMLPPAEFVPLAEESDLILTIDRWVLATACREVPRLREAFTLPHPPTLSVNLSEQTVAQPGLATSVRRILDASGFEARALRLEIAEAALLRRSADADAALAELRGIGVQVHVDGLGRGRSWRRRLSRLPVDALKLDGERIGAMLESDAGSEKLRALLRTAAELRLDITIGRVETEAQVEALRGLGFRYLQGRVFAPARPLGEA